MNHIHKLTQHQLTAAIAREVGRRNDPHEVFAVTREVTNDYRKWANEAMARLVYTASEAKQKNSVFSEGFAAIVKQHAKVLAAVNEARAVFGFTKYAQDFAIWSSPMEVMPGSEVWQACNTPSEVVALLKHDRKRYDMLHAWGRSLVHGVGAVAAAKLMSEPVRQAYKASLLAIGRAVARKGNHERLVAFGDGLALDFAVEAYEAAIAPEGKKPGRVIRGVGDAIKAALSSAYYDVRRATDDPTYPLRHVVSGHRTAFYLLRSEDHARNPEREGTEPYAGAEDVVVDSPRGPVNLGNTLTLDELHLAQELMDLHLSERAEGLLGNARAMFDQLTGGVKDGEVTYTEFDALKDATWTRLAEAGKARREAAKASKELEQALMAVQVATKMDAVSRRVFLKALEALPIAEATRLLAAERNAKEAKATKLAAEEAQEERRIAEWRTAQAEKAERERQAEEAEARRKEAQAKRAEDARRERELDAELVAKREAVRPAEPVVTRPERDMPSVAEYRELLRKKVTA